MAHGPAPSLKLAAAGVNESTNLLLRAPLRFALFLLRASDSTRRESDTDTETPAVSLNLPSILLLQGQLEILLLV